jgi:DNA mismatch repair protein MutH
LDFVDGADLKSVHTTASGDPRESIAITQAGLLDDIIDGHADFASSHVGEKVNRTLLVGICRNGNNPENWFFTFCFMMDLGKGEWEELALELEENYGYVSGLTHERLDTTGRIRGTDGRRHVLQIRTKDSKDSQGNYHPIVSERYGEVANKRHAWYITRYGARRIIKHGLGLQAA